MGLFGLNWQFPIYTRNKRGDSFYDYTSANGWYSPKNNLLIAQTHPLLTPALLFVSKLFSQAEFKISRSNNGADAPNHPMLGLLKNPNMNQTLPDLLESLLFTQIANGVGVLYAKKNILTQSVNSLYVLDYSKIDFPDTLDKGKFKNASQKEEYLNTSIKYDEDGEDLNIKLKDLLFFYDLPNYLNDNPFVVSSRLDGLKQTLTNTIDMAKAKSIIIKSNGKELISGQKDGFPLGKDEKEAVENRWNNNYGVGWNKKRGIVTKSNLKWQSMHIIARDLGYDEGTKTDAAVIFTALHIPNDVYSISGAKSTYKNANASLISYIQNEMMPTLNSFIKTISSLLPNNYELSGTYNHLPVMLPSLTVQYENTCKQMKALSDARSAGISDEQALEMAGLPRNTVLNPIETQENNGQQGNSNY
jgi:hypothetical protein|tara:strand:+ start:420 stop:1670 length:1251 start_codon:yes stop_codon:yes gene_type:complete